MSMKELRQYVLENRHDQDAWNEYTSRPRPNAVIIPADEPPENMEHILREAISQPMLSKNTFSQSGNFGIGNMSGGTISGNAKIGGVINEAAQQDLTQAAAEIQDLLNQLQQSNAVTLETAQQQTAKNLVIKAQNDSNLKDRLIMLGKFIGDNSSKTVVSEAVKGVIKLFLLLV
ncbi:MAG: hypothetical protein AAFQ80_19485 [Cyanobacteria bacterium J06621_8]